jgi:hypothetical protein
VSATTARDHPRHHQHFRQLQLRAQQLLPNNQSNRAQQLHIVTEPHPVRQTTTTRTTSPTRRLHQQNSPANPFAASDSETVTSSREAPQLQQSQRVRRLHQLNRRTPEQLTRRQLQQQRRPSFYLCDLDTSLGALLAAFRRSHPQTSRQRSVAAIISTRDRNRLPE